MAKTKIVTDAEVSLKEAPAPPTLAAAAQASTDANNERLATLVERAGGPSAPAAATTAPAKTAEEEYAEWVESLPADKRTKFEDSVRTTHAQGLAEFYGPEVSQVLADVAKDPKLKKALSRMTDEKARQWILDTAFPIYDDERFGSPIGGDGTPAPVAIYVALVGEGQSNSRPSVRTTKCRPPSMPSASNAWRSKTRSPN